MTVQISADLRRAANNMQLRRKPIERGFGVRFLDALINHDDIDKFANGHGVTFLLEPGISVGGARESQVFRAEVTNIIGECTADLDAGFYNAYLVVHGDTRIEVNHNMQRPLRQYIRRWCTENRLPLDPMIWRLAGRHPPWAGRVGCTWSLIDSASFMHDCMHPRRRMETRTLEIPFVGVMNIDKAGEKQSSGGP